MKVNDDSTDERKASSSSDEAARLKKKQILVVLLLVGLMIAILTQPEPDAGDAIETFATASSAQGPPVVEPQEAESIESRMDRLSKVQEFERIELSEFPVFELFAPEPFSLQQPLGNASHRVQAIYGTAKQRAALVDQSIVRRGQPLPDGAKVLQITQDGIQVGR